MRPDISVTEVYSRVSELGAAMRALTEQDVYIGVPEDKTERREGDKEPMTNAYLSYIHEHGVPEKGIPARPHLIPGIEDIRPEAINILREAAKQALDGNHKAIIRALNRIGLLGQNAVRARFVNNNWQPLAPATLRRKIGGKTRLERGRTNPLIYTNQLRIAHTYVVRKRGGALEITYGD